MSSEKRGPERRTVALEAVSTTPSSGLKAAVPRIALWFGSLSIEFQSDSTPPSASVRRTCTVRGISCIGRSVPDC